MGRTRRGAVVAAALSCALVACSGLSDLSEETLAAAESRWRAAGVDSYRMALDVQGDRVERERYVVVVRSGAVDTLLRDRSPVTSGSPEDYSVPGLFEILRRERELAERPSLLGAPAGYRAYLKARFDPRTGRLVEYDRSVGGASNRIRIVVREFAPISPRGG